MTGPILKVLVVDDETDNIEYVQRALRQTCEVHLASSGEQGLELLLQHRYAVILSDIKMPGMSGVEFLSKSRELAPNTIRVILTGYADVDNAIDAINESKVSSFLRKPAKPAEIEKAIAGAMELYELRMNNVQLVTELEERNQQLADKEILLQLSLDEKTKELLRINRRLEEMVIRDGLTGVYNHRYFQERTEQEVERSRRYGSILSLVFFDLDHFKMYNDINGHPQGDQALKDVAEILANGSRLPDADAGVRETDVVARYGGEEFVILLPETSKEGAKIMAERLRVAVERHAFAGEANVPEGHLTVSAGVASCPSDAQTRGTLIERADEALYHAKVCGRNQVCVWEGDADPVT